MLNGPRTGHTAFIDAGGLDECFPTVRGTPDHGGLWNQPWDGPTDAPWITDTWPTSLELNVYGPSDGTAIGAVLVDCPTVSVEDRGAVLTLQLSCPGQPVSTALWRNQAGFPIGAPYRSLGVEPMLGRVVDLAEAGPGDAAVVPASGELTWRLTVSARPV
ncbi:hypothetical protein AB0F43_16040 [Kribbella sp. NPDC023972]|uniref:hypothetical protein n=1 Tax=Kribbella sp. NPDC023972 TaxID=3154795 RepID=UPI00340FCDB7